MTTIYLYNFSLVIAITNIVFWVFNKINVKTLKIAFKYSKIKIVSILLPNNKKKLCFTCFMYKKLKIT